MHPLDYTLTHLVLPHPLGSSLQCIQATGMEVNLFIGKAAVELSIDKLERRFRQQFVLTEITSWQGFHLGAADLILYNNTPAQNQTSWTE
jgi:hypothetical protein